MTQPSPVAVSWSHSPAGVLGFSQWEHRLLEHWFAVVAMGSAVPWHVGSCQTRDQPVSLPRQVDSHTEPPGKPLIVFFGLNILKLFIFPDLVILHLVSGNHRDVCKMYTSKKTQALFVVLKKLNNFNANSGVKDS